MSKKSVSFNPIDTVYTTYSSDEYDRSRFASVQPTSFKPNPQFVPTTTGHVDSACPKNSKKPKLSINTQSLTPLFFTGLSTHYKCNDEEEESYLIPVLVY